MITVKGDLASDRLKSVTSEVAGVAFPGVRAANCDEDRGLLWMAPDELLVLVPFDKIGSAVAAIEHALQDEHHLVVNVSEARALFGVSGPAVRDVVAKLTPADLHPDSFTTGALRRTRLAQVPAAFWMPHEDAFEIICFRSVAQYVFDLLVTAADPAADVGHF
jgi:sarcosine oxidase subunit gamma